MIGAIIGDIVGSRFEKKNYLAKDFKLFTHLNKFTDDTVLTIAIADAILNKRPYEEAIREYAYKYPFVPYGGFFKKWLNSSKKGTSFGNGAAMRVSPIGFYFDAEEDVLEQAYKSAVPSHYHQEAIKGTQVISLLIFRAREIREKYQHKEDVKDYLQRKGELVDYISTAYRYDLSYSFDDLRSDAKFDSSAAGTVPKAIFCFLCSYSFIDAIRTAVSIGGDSDTIASMTGALAEAFYGVSPCYRRQLKMYLPEEFLPIIGDFYQKTKWVP